MGVEPNLYINTSKGEIMTDKLVKFQKALEEFLSYAKDVPGNVAMLEGKVENLQRRKQIAEEELQTQLQKNKDVLQLEHEKVKLALARAQKLAVQAQESLHAIEKQRLEIHSNGHVVSKTELQKEIDDVKEKASRIQEELTI